jgi:glyoxalase family protein
MPRPVSLGLHHVTAISGAPRPGREFYRDLLGLRLVKRTVNFDAPSVHHLYYADDAARPGSVLTFFPYPGATAGRAGAGEAVEVAYAVPAGSLTYWMDRLADRSYDTWDAPETTFGEPALRVRDPDGTPLALVEQPAVTGGWEGGPIPLEAAAGPLVGVTLASRAADQTARILTEMLGFREVGTEDGRWRFANPRADRAGVVDLVPAPADGGRRGAGNIHHVAFRAADEEAQRALSEAALEHGLHPTEVRDRRYFKSVYFREPGGALFEIATDGPGFMVDEPAEALGASLQLPPWLEPRRAQIEASLPVVD